MMLKSENLLFDTPSSPPARWGSLDFIFLRQPRVASERAPELSRNTAGDKRDCQISVAMSDRMSDTLW